MNPSNYKKMTFEDKWLKHRYSKQVKRRSYSYMKRQNRKKFRRLTNMTKAEELTDE